MYVLSKDKVLTMRMSVRRLARKTSAFSKKSENHLAALRLHFGYYNFVRWHRTLKMTPAMAAGITDHAWTPEELVGKALKKVEVKLRHYRARRKSFHTEEGGGILTDT